MEAKSAADAPPIAPQSAPTEAPEVAPTSLAMAAAAAETSEAVDADAAPAGTPAPAPGSQPEPPTAPANAAVVREMLEIEARIEVAVANARRAAQQLRRAVEAKGGTVTNEVLRVDSDGHGTASLTLRVPAGSSNTTIAAIHELGQVNLQEITARDIGKEYFDAGVLLSNLEVTLARYQKILERAEDVKQVLEVEAQLTRIRGEIERVKGNLRYMRDRAARATLHVQLRSAEAELAADPRPEARFYPGLRATYLFDIRKDDEHGYWGGGVSIRFSRAFNIELDALRRVDSDDRGIDAFIATLGGDLFSDFFGAGKRRSFNPYLGYRLGYARFPDKEDAFALGAVLGLELLKTETVTVDLDLTGLGFLGEATPHFGIQPALGVNVAF